MLACFRRLCSDSGTKWKGLERLPRRIVIAVTGASGAIYGYRLLQKLREQENLQIHLVMSRSAEKTSKLELDLLVKDWKLLSDYSYQIEDVGARLASGSFHTDGMAVCPCSIHTLSAIAAGVSSNLIVRAADVCLKERRRLVLAGRETPFHLGNLRSMTPVREMRAIVAPPIPGFYHKPQTILDLVDHSVHRVMDLLGVPHPAAARWQDIKEDSKDAQDE